MEIQGEPENYLINKVRIKFLGKNWSKMLKFNLYKKYALKILSIFKDDI